METGDTCWQPGQKSTCCSFSVPVRQTQSGRDTGFVHGLIRGGRNIVHAAKEFGSDIVNPDMPVALSDQPEDQGSVAARLPGDTMFNKFVLRPAAEEKQRSLEEADAMHRTSG
jgi:hypothetical protein